MNTGISKNRGIGSLQYRYAKKNDAAHPYLDVSVISPMQWLTVSQSSVTQGHALSVAEDRKIAAHTTFCRSVGVFFIPLIVETLGGWSDQALETIRGIGCVKGLVSHQLSPPPPTFSSNLWFASGGGTRLFGRGDFLLVCLRLMLSSSLTFFHVLFL